MIVRGWIAALAATAVLGSAGAIAAPSKEAPAKASAARDWSKSVVATPEGGYRMGNPQAAVKLIEYGSFTCPTCGRFAKEGMPQLVRDYVRTGRVSFEYRNFVRDPADLGAALLSRCTTPANVLNLTERYFASQSEWLGRLQKLDDQQLAAMAKLPNQQRIARLASVAGLDAIAAKGGVTPARAAACLSDQKGLDRLLAMHRTATTQYALEGTPTFIVNGKKVHAHSWAELQPLLGPPGG